MQRLPFHANYAIFKTLHFSSRLLKLYNKFHELSYLSGNFTRVQLKYTNERWNELERKLTTKDRELFFSDIKDVVWDTYFRTYILGIRTCLLKDPIETLPEARRKWRRYLFSCLPPALSVCHSQ